MSSTTTFTQVQYARLLDLSIYHAYYEQGYCPCVTLEPSAECLAQLRGYRLLYKPTPLGGVIVGAMPATVALPGAQAPMTLDFYLRMRDTEFLAVTDLGNGGGSGASFHEYTGGAWTPSSGGPSPIKVPSGVVALLRVHVALVSGQLQEVRLELQVPEVIWHYYLVTGSDYAASPRIAENGRVVSSDLPASPEELALVQGRYKDKKIITIGVRLLLKRDLPPWYLVVDGVHSGTSHVPDVPPLPKPRPGAAPHLILDYSTILK